MKISNDAQAIIIKITKNGKLMFLVIKKFDKEKKETHFRFVKGGIKKEETSKQAVFREMKEEVGIDLYEKAAFLCHYNYIGGEVKHEVDVYLVYTSPNVSISIDSSEEGENIIYDGIWMTAEEAEENLNFKEEKKLIKKALKKI